MNRLAEGEMGMRPDEQKSRHKDLQPYTRIYGQTYKCICKDRMRDGYFYLEPK